MLNNWKDHIYDAKKHIQERIATLPEDFNYVPTIDVVDGVQAIVMSEFDFEHKGMSANDFSIQSLIDAGAVDMLKPVGKLVGNKLDLSDALDNGVVDLINEVDTLEYLNKSKVTENIENNNIEEKDFE